MSYEDIKKGALLVNRWMNTSWYSSRSRLFFIVRGQWVLFLYLAINSEVSELQGKSRGDRIICWISILRTRLLCVNTPPAEGVLIVNSLSSIARLKSHTLWVFECDYLIPFNFRPLSSFVRWWTKIKGVHKVHHFGWTKIKGSKFFSQPLKNASFRQDLNLYAIRILI